MTKCPEFGALRVKGALDVWLAAQAWVDLSHIGLLPSHWEELDSVSKLRSLALASERWDFRAGLERFDVSWPEVDELQGSWVNSHVSMLRSDQCQLTSPLTSQLDLVIVLGSATFTMGSRLRLLKQLERGGLVYKEAYLATAVRCLSKVELQSIRPCPAVTELDFALSEAQRLWSGKLDNSTRNGPDFARPTQPRLLAFEAMPRIGNRRATSFDVILEALTYASLLHQSALVITSDVYAAATAFDAVRAIMQARRNALKSLIVVGAPLREPYLAPNGALYQAALLQEMRSVIRAVLHLYRMVSAG